MDAALLARVASFLGNAAPPAATPAASAPAAAPVTNKSSQPAVGSTTEDAVQPPVYMIVFSKDRAFQLHQLLLSAQAHLDTSNTHVQISVLYLASEAFTASYERVAKQHSKVDFVAEQPGCFSEQLQTLVTASSSTAAAQAFILFAVDDMIFYAQPSFPLAAATAALSSKPNAYGAQLKLSPCITHSHAAASACKVPALHFIDTSTPGLQLFEFEPESVRGGANDWDYAWDLTGGLYRQADVAELLTSISALHANDATATGNKRTALNPNLLELYGNQVLRAQWAAAAAVQQRTMLCAGAPVLSAITINRVQTTFATPVYDSGNGDVLKLDKRLWRGEVVDTAWYSTQQFRSVHIAELVLKPAKSAPAALAAAVPVTADGLPEGLSSVQIAADSAAKPLVSVLLPVHNGEQWLRTAVQSILAQTFTAFELIIIDDGSTDSSVQCISDLVHSDARIVLVQQQQQRGLAETLNNGLQLARCELVARMDADDVAVPRRLQRQYSYMQAHPSVQVLSTAVATFSGNGNPLQSADGSSSSSGDSSSSSSSSSGSVCAQRVVVHPTDAAVLEWELLFSCCIAHPSVMLRKSAVLNNSSIAAYSKSAEPAEDYTLWLQLLAAARTNSSSSSVGDTAAAAAVAAVTDDTTSSGVVFACLGEVLLWHRKHTRSASAAQLQLQQAKALQAATQAVTALLRTATDATTQQHQQQLVNERFVAVLKAPEAAATIAEATGALQLLLALADSAVAAAQRCGCTDEALVIRERANARLGALACTAMSKFGSAAAPLLQQWTQRCPGASPGSMLMALSTALSSSS
jgi:Glycosyl transferase family 2